MGGGGLGADDGPRGRMTPAPRGCAAHGPEQQSMVDKQQKRHHSVQECRNQKCG